MSARRQYLYTVMETAKTKGLLCMFGFSGLDRSESDRQQALSVRAFSYDQADVAEKGLKYCRMPEN